MELGVAARAEPVLLAAWLVRCWRRPPSGRALLERSALFWYALRSAGPRQGTKELGRSLADGKAHAAVRAAPPAASVGHGAAAVGEFMPSWSAAVGVWPCAGAGPPAPRGLGALPDDIVGRVLEQAGAEALDKAVSAANPPPGTTTG